ncbi:hypothetical protein PSCICO_46770 [Pseudomonas cichorii]|nr:hypothetical protein PSCICO_46770 [Pseudomonas cichorii]GID07823.1 hypothetical protein TMM008_50250 [Pseudomonas sp. 008]
MGGGPYGGQKPASEGTGQAEACPARTAIEKQQLSLCKHLIAGYGAMRLEQFRF